MVIVIGANGDGVHHWRHLIHHHWHRTIFLSPLAQIVRIPNLNDTFTHFCPMVAVELSPSQQRMEDTKGMAVKMKSLSPGELEGPF